jgi:uncharacterized protein with NRDE domain
MCLALFAWKAHPKYRLILAANRDEFNDRAASRPHWWGTEESLLSGRDLLEGGTWLGVNRSGAFAAVTNYREPADLGTVTGKISRGSLVANYLEGGLPPEAYVRQVAAARDNYRGMNLLVGNLEEMWYVSNRTEEFRPLEPGIYGLSNHLLDSPWHKVVLGKLLFTKAILRPDPDPEQLFELMTDKRQVFDDSQIPDTGIPREIERFLSSMFIAGKEYGTRVTTVVLISESEEVYFAEKSYLPEGPMVAHRFQAGVPTPEYIR